MIGVLIGWAVLVLAIVALNWGAHRKPSPAPELRTPSLKELRRAEAAKAKRRNKDRARQMRKRGAR